MAIKLEDQYGGAVAAQIRAELGAAGISIAELARRIDTNRETLDRWVKGKRALTVPVLYRICAGIPIDPRVLVERATLRFHEEVHTDQMSAVPASIGAPIVSLSDYRKEPPLDEEASAAGDVADAEDPDD